MSNGVVAIRHSFPLGSSFEMNPFSFSKSFIGFCLLVYFEFVPIGCNVHLKTIIKSFEMLHTTMYL